MGTDSLTMVVAFALAGSLAGLAGLLVLGRNRRLDERIDALVGREVRAPRPDSMAQLARTTLPKMGRIIVPDDEAERTLLTARLVHAGFYGRQAMHVFLGVKLALLVLATAVGMGLTLTGTLPVGKALPASLALFVVGMIGPSFWLDRRKAARQAILRRGLPDALDVLIICVEGGLSMQAGIKRVADELREAHPALGAELRIVDREVQLGRTAGDALGHFARRSDLEEVAGLASVVNQSERFGASLAKSLRTHSDGLRVRRKQRAEEQAQKASTKILIPTLLCIFPALFVILLAPAAYQVARNLLGPTSP